MQTIILDLLSWEKLFKTYAYSTTSIEARENLRDVAGRLREIIDTLMTGKNSEGKSESPRECGQKLLRIWRITHDQEWQFSTLTVLGNEANQLSLSLSFIRDTAESLLRDDYIKPDGPVDMDEVMNLMNPIGICQSCTKVVELRAGLCPYCKKKTEIEDVSEKALEDTSLEFIHEQEVDFEMLAPSTIFKLSMISGAYECIKCGYSPYQSKRTRDIKCRDIHQCPSCGVKDEHSKSGPTAFVGKHRGRVKKGKGGPGIGGKHEDIMAAVKQKAPEAKKVLSDFTLGKSSWPCSGGNYRRSGLSSQTGPKEGKILWSIKLGAGLTAGPVVGIDGHIYVGTHEDGFVKVLKEGRIDWTFKLREPVKAAACISSNGNILFGTPTKFYNLNPGGTPRWTFKGGCVHSPTISPDGSIVFGSESTLYSLDRDGKEKWHYDFGEKVEGMMYDMRPAVDDEGKIYVVTDKLTVLSPEGKVLYYAKIMGRGSAPAVDHLGRTLVGTENHFWCLKTDGNRQWGAELTDLVSTAPVEINGGIVTWGTQRRGSVISMTDKGLRNWNTNLDVALAGYPAADQEGNMYFTDESAKIHALSNRGKKLWELSSKRAWIFGGANFNPSPAIGPGGIMYVTCQDGKLYAVI